MTKLLLSYLLLLISYSFGFAQYKVIQIKPGANITVNGKKLKLYDQVDSTQQIQFGHRNDYIKLFNPRNINGVFTLSPHPHPKTGKYELIALIKYFIMPHQVQLHDKGSDDELLVMTSISSLKDLLTAKRYYSRRSPLQPAPSKLVFIGNVGHIYLSKRVLPQSSEEGFWLADKSKNKWVRLPYTSASGYNDISITPQLLEQVQGKSDQALTLCYGTKESYDEIVDCHLAFMQVAPKYQNALQQMVQKLKNLRQSPKAIFLSVFVDFSLHYRAIPDINSLKQWHSQLK